MNDDDTTWQPVGLFDLEQSIALRRILGEHCWEGACYRSAVCGLRYGLKSLQGAVYVEGYAVPPFYLETEVIAHGWLELPDGTVIDPTAIACHEGAFCTPDTEPWDYFAAMRYTIEELEGVALNSLPRTWEDDQRRSEPHRKALRQAEQVRRMKQRG